MERKRKKYDDLTINIVLDPIVFQVGTEVDIINPLPYPGSREFDK